MTPTAPTAAAITTTRRVTAIDVLRGFVMVLMSIDHASETFNSGRYIADTAFWPAPSGPLPTAQFVTRWITHLCAPTFIALAGASLAMSTESRRKKGDSEAAITRQIALRGLLIVGIEVLWMSPLFAEGFGEITFQVMYAIGASFICMAFLRRLPDRALFSLALVLGFGSELVVNAMVSKTGALTSPIPVAVLFTGGAFFDGAFVVAYPLAPWLAIMCLGWVFGRRLMAEGAARMSRTLVFFGIFALVLFIVLRAINGWGNMHQLRIRDGWLEWLRVSKYPPSVTFDALELGIAALLLAALMRLRSVPSPLAPIQLFGQTALFYYVLHLHVLHLIAYVTHQHRQLGVASCYYGALVVLVLLYPACLWYRRYKSAHPDGWARWI